MYIPKFFLPNNDSHVEELVRENPLVTVHSIIGDSLQASSLPVIWEKPKEGGPLALMGHIARANPHCKILLQKPEAFLLIVGPNCYVSPQWYPSGNDVPTWNYVSAQLRVRVECIQEERDVLEILKRQSAEYELANQTNWNFELPKDLAAPGAIRKYIMGLRFHILEKEVKVKMNQNRSKIDSAGVVKHLKKKNSERSLEVARWMEKYQTSLPVNSTDEKKE